MTENFEVELLEEAIEFVESIDSKSREKIFFNIKKAQFINDEELFKKLKGNIWEFRTLYNKQAYRLFAFWDKENGKKALVLVSHGIIKKTDKTPIKEIEKAEQIRIEYFKNK